jgi:hypothetical protein
VKVSTAEDAEDVEDAKGAEDAEGITLWEITGLRGD